MQANNTLYRESAWQALSLQQHGPALLTPSFRAWVICSALLIWVAAMVAMLISHSFTEKTTVVGYITTQQPSVSISPKESVGVITQVYVQNGDSVSQGQPLLSVKRPSVLIMGEQNLAEQLVQLQYQLQLMQDTRQELAYENHQQQAFLSQQLISAKDQHTAITEQMRYLNQRIEMAQLDVQKLDGLYAKQLVSLNALNAAKQTLLSMRQQQAQFTQQLSDNDITQTQLSAQYAKLVQQVAQQSTQTELQQLPVEQQIKDLQAQRSYTIYATRDGIVNNLHAQAGDDIGRFSVLLKLAHPDQDMQLQLAVPASAAGFIGTSQDVRVRLDAFPYQKYGTLNAQISEVSQTITLPNENHAHAISIQEPVFMVRARLVQNYIAAKGEQIPLKEGMTVQADVVLSERSLFEWLLSPLYSMKGSL